jgi:DNA-binding SARP family transcriptional activator
MARRERLVLAYFALNCDRAITRETLMRCIWGEDVDPNRVNSSLSSTLSRVRAVVEGRLETLPSGALQLRGPVRTDVAHAEETLEQARLAQTQNDWARVAEAARAVLDELNGEVLAGYMAGGNWLERVRDRAASATLEALELRATASLRTGDLVDALATAQHAVDEGGTRESAWRLLIEAQAAAGDIARASRTYHDLRGLMAESGLTPGRELTALHERLVTGGVDRTFRLTFPPALVLEGAFVGRAPLLAELRSHYARAAAGMRQLVILRGEPGIGKTRVAAELARTAFDDGAIVLYGRSDPDALAPYQPFVTAIGQHLTERGDGTIARELRAELSELARLLPRLLDLWPELGGPPPADPDTGRYRLFTAASAVLTFIARERPAVLVLDDLQWADDSTALLLEHAIRDLDDVKLLVLGTIRSDVSPRSERLADLLAQPAPGRARPKLAGLSVGETAAFVNTRRAGRSSAETVAVLAELTDGNPLLLEETLKSLAESESSAEGLTVESVRRASVSERVKHVVTRRVQRLTATTQSALGEASIIGPEFDVRVLEIMAATDPGAFEGPLKEAATAGLVRERPDSVGRFSFSHALVRDTLREGHTGLHRRRLHHRVGIALETLRATSPVSPAELAYHFAESGDDQKALEYLLEAARRATDALAHDEAAQHYLRALTHVRPDDAARRCELLIEAGHAQRRHGSPEFRRTFRRASELAEAGGLVELSARAALGFASRYTEAGVVDDEEIALLTKARARLRSGALAVEVTARLADSVHFGEGPDASDRLSDEALTMARALDDPRALACALESRHAALMSVEHHDERIELSKELIDLAHQADDRELKALAHHWRIYDLLEEVDRADEALDERMALEALASELGQPLFEHFVVGWKVVWALMLGRTNEVEALSGQFRALGEQAHARDTETLSRAQIIALRRRQERLADFVVSVQNASRANPKLLAWRAVLPLTYFAGGEVDAAKREFGWFAEANFEAVRHDMFWFAAICVLAETCALLGDRARADVLYKVLLPYEDRNVQVLQAACWGSSERFLGLLDDARGRFDAAEAHLESAISKNEASGNPAAASLVRRDLATLLSKTASAR